jgi:hypothetical protein
LTDAEGSPGFCGPHKSTCHNSVYGAKFRAIMSPQDVPLNPIIYPMVIFAALLVVALLLITFAISSISLTVRRRRKQAIQGWKAKGIAMRVTPGQANFLNEARAFGVGNNGTLALTADALRFAQVMPEREIVIRLDEIASVHVVNAFNGRIGGGPFLVIKRKVGDLTGFQITNPRRWADLIDGARLDGSDTLASPGELAIA